MTTRAGLITVSFCLMASNALAGWTILAVEKSTGTIVIASAACVPQLRFANFPARDLMDIQAIVAPGKGVAAVQAIVDPSRAVQTTIHNELVKGTAPLDILQALLASDAKVQSRQMAVIDLEGRSAGFSGTGVPALVAEKQDKIGEDVFVVIQGSSLSSADVIQVAMQAFKATRGTLADRVIAAMEAGDSKGGDKRCSCATPVPFIDGKNPLEKIPCDAKFAHVAYILRADATDKNVSSFNDGRYAMYISVTDRDITPKENANPIRTLRKRYDAWVKEQVRSKK